MYAIYTIDLDTKTLSDNGKLLIYRGKAVNAYKIPDDNITFDRLNELYQNYKHSVPDNVRNKYHYFKALPYEQLTIKDLATGQPRQLAKDALEMAVLIGSLNGSLKWPDSSKWFWQSNIDKDFVILRKWILSEDNKGGKDDA